MKTWEREGAVQGEKDLQMSHRETPTCDIPVLLKVTGIKLLAVSCEEKAFLSPFVMAGGMTGCDNNSVLQA